MRVLLDTHVLLWWLSDSPKLGSQGRRSIADPENVVFVSVASLWEMSIKASLGKLQVPVGPVVSEELSSAGFEILAIQPAHAWATRSLPSIHRDPFDRMLLAQATVEGLTLLTNDEDLAQYGDPVWRLS